jgi:hypothetical protein
MDEERPAMAEQPLTGSDAEDTKIVSDSEQTRAGLSEDTVATKRTAGGAGLSTQQTRLVVGGMVLIVLLIIAGLFLPPISLGQRLGLGGDRTEAVAEQAAGETAGGDRFLIMAGGPVEDLVTTIVARSAFLADEAGEEWVAAAGAIPDNLTLVSDLYAISYEGEPVPGFADIQIPAEAQPYQTMDLYAWDGNRWSFVPVQVQAGADQITTAERDLPRAFAFMQTAAPADPVIAAHLLPTQELPAALLPLLTEVSVGTLTLNQDGQLLGELGEIPEGPSRRLIRATNTGAIVDTISLAAVLGDPALQQQNIAALVSQAQAGNFDGVNLDYQGVGPSQSQAFTSFVSDLAGALHAQGKLLVLTLETPYLQGSEWDTAGQDWQALGQIADAIYLQMPLDPAGYDDNGYAEQVVGWAVRQVDRYKLTALTTVSAVDRVGDSMREVGGSEALASFGEISFVTGAEEVAPGGELELSLTGLASPLEWDPASVSYQYTYEESGQAHRVWLSNEAAFAHRARFGNRYHLRGLAISGLGHVGDGSGYAAAINSYLGAGEAPQPLSAAVVWAVEDESGGIVASSSGELTFAWTAAQEPGLYLVRASFAQGDNVAELDEVTVNVMEPVVEEPEEEPEEEVAQATATPGTTGTPASVSVGDADAVANTMANVRNGPGLNFGIVGGVNQGDRVSLIGRNADRTWYQVVLADRTEGWIFAQLLIINSRVDTNALAVVEVEPPAGSVGAAPPPAIAPAVGGNFELGGQTHSLANPTLMKSAGMTWVKFQHKWGPGDSPGSVAGRIQQAHANGLKVLLSIPGADAYPSSIDFASYVQFLGGVAALGPDAIEVWNEQNIDFEWPAGQIDPASYVNNMLAPAYNAIKAANPNVMVISGAPAPTGFDNGTNAWADARYMAGVAAAGGGNYMDCIGVHHNAGATSPNASSGHPANSSHYSWYFFPTLNMYYNAFGGARRVCFTELGFLSGEDFGGVPSRFSWAGNTTVAQHAQWLAEAASLSANSGRVRMMIIFNVDFTHWGDDPQAGYAMIRPNGSCPSCSLLAQVMGR